MASTGSIMTGSANAPAQDFIDIIPEDGVVLPPGIRALSCTASGTVSVQAISGSAAHTIYLNAGDRWPVFAKIVNASGTTAAGIVGVI